jgi:NTE family protein
MTAAPRRGHRQSRRPPTASRFGRIGLAVALLAVPCAANARPRVGIALSGGGARGVAHIGVLRVLEELHVPIDVVAGTSMGSIVGGLYASGMTPEEIESALLAVDWDDALRDKPPRDQLSFRRKNDDLRYVPDFEVGVGRGGLLYPTGLRSGQKLGFLLRRLALPARATTDFDELPTPFRAVATDIASGEPVVLGSGDLARALRASMAIPSAFSAVEIDGRLLVDGGISNNLPVDVVRAMGADVVIAVDIGDPMLTTEEVRDSLFKILEQTVGMITRANMKSRLAEADLVITPEVAGFAMLGFDRSAEILERGVDKARAMAGDLATLAIPEAEYREWQAARRRTVPPLPIVSEVRFEGNERVDRRVLEALARVAPGTTLDLDAVESDLGRLFGLGDFEAVDFDLADADAGTTAVVYRLREKPWGPSYLRAGLEMNLDTEGRNDLGALARLAMTRLNRRGAEWTTDFKIGGDRYVRSEVYLPLTFQTGWFATAGGSYENRLSPIFEDGRHLANVEVRDSAVGAGLGYTFGDKGEARLAVVRRWVHGHTSTGEPPAEFTPFLGRTVDAGGVVLSGIVDRLDNARIPRRGGLARLDAFQSLEALGAESEYTKVRLRLNRYFTRGRHTAFGSFEGGASPGGELPLFDEHVFGGFFSLSGFAQRELRGQSFAVARLGYLHRFGKRLYAGGYVEAAHADLTTSDVVRNPILAATAVAASDTPVGPVYLGFGDADGGRPTLYLLFGRGF